MALKDAELSIALVPTNEEFRLVMATCQMRLHQLAEAAKTIKDVIDLNPTNEKALYHEAFCHRLDGRFRESIGNQGITHLSIEPFLHHKERTTSNANLLF